jgi:hypothetical protein
MIAIIASLISILSLNIRWSEPQYQAAGYWPDNIFLYKVESIGSGEVNITFSNVGNESICLINNEAYIALNSKLRAVGLYGPNGIIGEQYLTPQNIDAAPASINLDSHFMCLDIGEQGGFNIDFSSYFLLDSNSIVYANFPIYFNIHGNEAGIINGVVWIDLLITEQNISLPEPY